MSSLLSINKDVPQGTILGPILFSVMLDIKPVYNNQSILVAFADDLTLSVLVKGSKTVPPRST